MYTVRIKYEYNNKIESISKKFEKKILHLFTVKPPRGLEKSSETNYIISTQYQQNDQLNWNERGR